MKELNKLNLKNKKYIIFDMDGTLIDSVGVWNITDQELIKEYGGLELDLDTVQTDRHTFLHNHQDSDNIYLAYAEYVIDKYHLTIKNPKQLMEIRLNKSSEILEHDMDFKPYAVDLLFRLKSLGFTLVLATMTTQVQLDIYSHKNQRMMSQMNIEETFDFIITQDDVKNKKPHPEIYNKIIEYYGAKPNECLVFEDSYTGVLASNNAGIEVVNIYDKYSDVDRRLINEITDYSIKNYSEFIDYLNSAYEAKASQKIG